MSALTFRHVPPSCPSSHERWLVTTGARDLGVVLRRLANQHFAFMPAFDQTYSAAELREIADFLDARNLRKDEGL